MKLINTYTKEYHDKCKLDKISSLRGIETVWIYTTFRINQINQLDKISSLRGIETCLFLAFVYICKIVKLDKISSLRGIETIEESSLSAMNDSS